MHRPLGDAQSDELCEEEMSWLSTFFSMLPEFKIDGENGIIQVSMSRQTND